MCDFNKEIDSCVWAVGELQYRSTYNMSSLILYSVWPIITVYVFCCTLLLYSMLYNVWSIVTVYFVVRCYCTACCSLTLYNVWSIVIVQNFCSLPLYSVLLTGNIQCVLHRLYFDVVLCGSFI